MQDHLAFEAILLLSILGQLLFLNFNLVSFTLFGCKTTTPPSVSSSRRGNQRKGKRWKEKFQTAGALVSLDLVTSVATHDVRGMVADGDSDIVTYSGLEAAGSVWDVWADDVYVGMPSCYVVGESLVGQQCQRSRVDHETENQFHYAQPVAHGAARVYTGFEQMSCHYFSGGDLLIQPGVCLRGGMFGEELQTLFCDASFWIDRLTTALGDPVPVLPAVNSAAGTDSGLQTVLTHPEHRASDGGMDVRSDGSPTTSEISRSLPTDQSIATLYNPCCPRESLNVPVTPPRCLESLLGGPCKSPVSSTPPGHAFGNATPVRESSLKGVNDIVRQAETSYEQPNDREFDSGAEFICSVRANDQEITSTDSTLDALLPVTHATVAVVGDMAEVAGMSINPCPRSVLPQEGIEAGVGALYGVGDRSDLTGASTTPEMAFQIVGDWDTTNVAFDLELQILPSNPGTLINDGTTDDGVLSGPTQLDPAIDALETMTLGFRV